MKRELKFRAWLNEYRLMCKVTDIDFESNNIIAQVNSSINRLERIKVGFEDCKIMQFTGLQDNNGKEIYEGDILKLEVNKRHSQPNIGVIVFDEDSRFSIADNIYKKHGLPITWGGYLSKVIIGNIYEHPHLLDKPNEAN